MKNQEKYQGQHILAVDYGTKFTGFANYKVGMDPFILLFGRVKYESDKQIITEIQKIIDYEFIEQVVIGIPFFTDGKESTWTQSVKKFIDLASQSLEVPVHTQDETLSTFEAEDRMKNDPRFNFQVDLSRIDEVAASIILESFLIEESKWLEF